MARMIPPFIDSEVKSNAERTVFEWLKKSEWKNAVVLHSLGIAQHINNIFGEIDFVVISNEGILCIEVKGGRVYRENGMWFFQDRFNNINSKQKGPFEQAQGNMQSLREYLKKILPKGDPLCRCQYASCVVAPDCIIKTNGTDIISEILFDARNGSNELVTFFEKSFDYWRKRCYDIHHFEGGKLVQDDIERAVKLLRGNFNFVPSLSIVLNKVEDVLLSVTEEQYIIMSGIDVNDRMLIQGAAGTGKTLLAVEQCRKLESKGKKVLYLCYNRVIANYLRECLASEKLNIQISTLHEIMANYCSTLSGEKNSEYYQNILPEMFLKYTETGAWNDNSRFDAVIIDEGQDLMTTNYYWCINELIRKGFADGIWSIYFDPNQNIFNSNNELQDIWTQLKHDAASFSLSVNCRNTRQIVVTNKQVSNIPQALITRAEGYNNRPLSYQNLKDEREQVINTVRNLRTQGIDLSDIKLLSPYSIESPKCCLNGACIPKDIETFRITPHDHFNKKDCLDFFTIQSYKGMEARIVILMDIDSFQDDKRRLLNYTAISRAKTLLYIFYSAQCEDERQELLLKGSLMK